MAVENLQLPGDFPDEAAVLANVRKVVRTLMLLNGDMSAEELGHVLGMSESNAYNRLSDAKSGSRFTVAEVYRLARFFDVPVGTFYEPPELATIGYMSNTAGHHPWPLIDGDARQGKLFPDHRVSERHLATV